MIHIFLLLWNCVTIIQCFLYPVIDPVKLYNYTAPEDQVTFYLYSYDDLSNPDQIFVDNPSSISDSRFDPDLETKVIIHGWSHNRNVPWLVEMREAMANREQWNIIVVDWAPLSHVIYIEARVHTTVVSKQVAHMILTLKRFAGLHLADVHLIGHSMGAQISAYAGLKVHEITLEKIGLDPAGPLYEWPHMESLDEVLDASDAEFVDVIHTNGGRIGMITPAGHLDYYPNGGERQPGCELWGCSHLRSVEYWTASVKNPWIFQAYLYRDWVEYWHGLGENIVAYPMGILANKSFPSGTYYVEVHSEFKMYLNTVTTIHDSFS
ncbi:pancreatic lipase-related protein 2 isoform X2 [Dendroctonus ponderosae]|uniref:pancreatic lipase-related protein 2 isoform X2 n=1 Tax=Dendroctonus ponderosae TaxID=77166 RepID=UPI0020358C21|nr:pancreatic lipase-related protein 2 isoform X2 [Dendroctonus ponderosae]